MNKTFTVNVRRTCESYILVDAKTQADAEDKIEKMMDRKLLDSFDEYEFVFDFPNDEVIRKD